MHIFPAIPYPYIYLIFTLLGFASECDTSSMHIDVKSNFMPQHKKVTLLIWYRLDNLEIMKYHTYIKANIGNK